MRYFAIDQSTSCVGWCVADDERYVVSGTFQPKGKDVLQNLIKIETWLHEMLWTYKPDVLVLEYPSGTNNHDTTVKLGGLLYQCLIVFHHYSMTYGDKVVHIVKPTEIKKTGIYKGQLEAVKKYKKFPVITKPNGKVNKAAMARQDNEIDAIGCWLAGLEKEQENAKSYLCTTIAIAFNDH